MREAKREKNERNETKREETNDTLKVVWTPGVMGRGLVHVRQPPWVKAVVDVKRCCFVFQHAGSVKK